MTDRSNMMQPLRDIRVIEVAGYVTGPLAGMMLADLGADVVKVEPPRGDPYRRIGLRRGPNGVGAININRGKRSIALDLKADADRAVLFELLATADVLLENWRPGAADRLGLDDTTLESRFPRLIHLAMTGFGPDGPLAGAPAFDNVMQARTGMAWLRAVEGAPAPVPTYIADKTTSHAAVQALLAALLERQRTGLGGRLDVSMLDAVSYFNFPDVMEARSVGIPDSGESDLPWLPTAAQVSTTVRACDGWIVVSPSSGAHLRAVCQVAGHPEWMDEISTLRGFTEVGPALVRLLTPVVAEKPVAHWVELFAQEDVPAGPVWNPDQHLADPQVVHSGIYGEDSHDHYGRFRWARYPARWRSAGRAVGQRPPDTRPAPMLDEHRDEIRAELRRR